MAGSPFTDLGGDVEIINGSDTYGALYARRGMSSRGKARTTVEIVSEPVMLDLDELRLGAGPAAVIRDLLEEQTSAITAPVAPSTAERRLRAADAYDRGEPWALRRYSGGRTGPAPPRRDDRHRYGNDSGRLARGYFVRENPSDRTWTVNVPANRLDLTTFGQGFSAFLDKLRSLVPILGDSRKLADEPRFEAAVSKALDEAIAKAQHGQEERLRRLAQIRRQAIMRLVRAALGA